MSLHVFTKLAFAQHFRENPKKLYIGIQQSYYINTINKLFFFLLLRSFVIRRCAKYFHSIVHETCMKVFFCTVVHINGIRNKVFVITLLSAILSFAATWDSCDPSTFRIIDGSIEDVNTKSDSRNWSYEYFTNVTSPNCTRSKYERLSQISRNFRVREIWTQFKMSGIHSWIF